MNLRGGRVRVLAVAPVLRVLNHALPFAGWCTAPLRARWERSVLPDRGARCGTTDQTNCDVSWLALWHLLVGQPGAEEEMARVTAMRVERGRAQRFVAQPAPSLDTSASECTRDQRGSARAQDVRRLRAGVFIASLVAGCGDNVVAVVLLLAQVETLPVAFRVPQPLRFNGKGDFVRRMRCTRVQPHARARAISQNAEGRVTGAPQRLHARPRPSAARTTSPRRRSRA
jgi:hypothetical protein